MVYISNLIVILIGISSVTKIFIDLSTISQSCEILNFGHHLSGKQWKKLPFDKNLGTL
jgi:hypothetical protein